MNTEDKIKVMQAYADGKTIQTLMCDGWADWGNCNEPIWDWKNFDYRIKPNSQYRPYVDTAELIEDYEKRFDVLKWPTYAKPIIWVKCANKYRKDGYEHHLVTYFGEIICALGETMYDMETLYNEFTYLDGSPVGKLVE